jgi:hypothetical protein
MRDISGKQLEAGKLACPAEIRIKLPKPRHE